MVSINHINKILSLNNNELQTFLSINTAHFCLPCFEVGSDIFYSVVLAKQQNNYLWHKLIVEKIYVLHQIILIYF